MCPEQTAFDIVIEHTPQQSNSLIIGTICILLIGIKQSSGIICECMI